MGVLRLHFAIVGGLLFVGVAACGGPKPNPGGPTPTPTPIPTPTPTVTTFTVDGNVQLTEIGATAQLSAAARFTDASTRDVTQEASWSSADSSVVTVSAGLVRVVAFGRTSVIATYQGRGATIPVTATPAGTFIITGGVREPGQGWMANVEVVETISGRSTTTRNGGGFTIAAIATPTVRLAVRRDAYEPIEVEAPSNPDPSVDLPIQKIIRVAAGEKFTPPSPLAEHDLTYMVGAVKCVSCRLIRFVMPRPGTVRFQITWQGSSRLTLLAGGRVVESGTPLVAEIPFNDAGEHTLHFGSVDGTGFFFPGGSASRILFTIETAMP